MNNKLLKIEQGTVEFLLLKDNVELIVLQNQNNNSMISVLSSSNGKFDYNNVGIRDGKNKFEEVLNNFNRRDFFIFGDETKTLFGIRKSFVLSFVKVIEPVTLVSSFNLLDKQNNKYNLGINLSEDEMNYIIESVLS